MNIRDARHTLFDLSNALSRLGAVFPTAAADDNNGLLTAERAEELRKHLKELEYGLDAIRQELTATQTP